MRLEILQHAFYLGQTQSEVILAFRCLFLMCEVGLHGSRKRVQYERQRRKHRIISLSSSQLNLLNTGARATKRNQKTLYTTGGASAC